MGIHKCKKDIYYVKRFLIESTTKKVLFIPDDDKSELIVASTQYLPKVKIEFNKRLKETKDLPDKTEELNALIDVKGLKAQGNQLTKLKVKTISLLPTLDGEDCPIDNTPETNPIPKENEVISKEEVLGSLNDDNKVEIELDISTNENSVSSQKKSSDGQINLF